MKRHKKNCEGLGVTLLGLSLLALPALVNAADDPTINRMLASQCSQCHGTNGYAVGDIDSLAGESAREIREEMDEMQLEGTPDDIMDHQALGYTDDQIRRIAAYFAALPERRPSATPVIRLSASGSASGGASGSGGSSDDEWDREEDRDEDADREHEEDRDKERAEKKDRDENTEREDRRERHKRRSEERDEDDDDDDEDERN